MGPIEAELRSVAETCGGLPVQRVSYQFLSGLARWCLEPNSGASRVLYGAADQAGVSIYSEDAWSEAIEAAEALGL